MSCNASCFTVLLCFSCCHWRKLLYASQQLGLELHVVCLQQAHNILERLEDIVGIGLSVPDLRHDAEHPEQGLEVVSGDVQLERFVTAGNKGV